jgi:predicted NBD/HSP70 family sugar kinase
VACIFSGIDKIHEGTRYRIKDLNKAQIYETVCRHSVTSRKELVAETEIRPSTISDMVQQLITDGLVIESGRRNQGVMGRPEVNLYPNYNRLCAIALYIVSHEMKCELVNAGGKILASESRFLSPGTDNSVFLKVMHELIDSIALQVPPEGQALGVSVTLPGFVNGRTRTWGYAARWPKLHDVVFNDLERSVGLPIVANRALDAELQYLMLRNPRFTRGGTLLFHWGYGIGASYAFDGNIIKTSFGSFCEIGHLALYPDSGRKCTCGATGCVETVAALWALIPDFRRIDPDVPEEEREFEAYIHKHNIDDHESVKRATEAIGHAMAILQTTFLPDRIIVYGPMMSSSRIFNAVIERVKSVTSDFALKKLNIEFIDTTFEGDVVGGTSDLFRQAFRTYLTAH